MGGRIERYMKDLAWFCSLRRRESEVFRTELTRVAKMDERRGEWDIKPQSSASIDWEGWRCWEIRKEEKKKKKRKTKEAATVVM
jgi:hypothetical protein